MVRGAGDKTKKKPKKRTRKSGSPKTQSPQTGLTEAGLAMCFLGTLESATR
jgi:hypothetical protein